MEQFDLPWVQAVYQGATRQPPPENAFCSLDLRRQAECGGCARRGPDATFLRGTGRPPRHFCASSSSVTELEARLLELASAGVADEVVARVDVVDTQAVRAGIALADVALQEVAVVDDGVAPAVLEPAFRHGLPAGLAVARWLHTGLPGPRVGVRLWNYDSIGHRARGLSRGSGPRGI